MSRVLASPLSHSEMREREESWNRTVTEGLLPMSVRLVAQGHDRQDRTSLRRRAVADLTLAEWICPASEGHRRREQHRVADPNMLLVLFATRGSERITHGPSQTLLSARTGLIFSSSELIDFATEGHLTKLSLAVPRVTVEEFAPSVAIGHGMSLDSDRPSVKLLRGMLELMWTGGFGMDPHELDHARNALLNLLVAALGQEELPSSDAIVPLLRRQLDEWIDKHVSLGPMTVSDIAAAHYVSERTVQRVYAQNADTVTGVIRRRRIQKARAELISTDHSIAAVAARSGYFDSSHFAREFRHHYGTTPRECREEHRATSQSLSLAPALPHRPIEGRWP